MQMSVYSSTACTSCKLYVTSSCFMASALSTTKLDQIRHLQHFEQDKELIQPETKSSMVGLVVEGVLRSTHLTIDGHQEVVNFYESGSVFGHAFEMLSLYGVETATPALLCCFDRQQFERIINEDTCVLYGYMMATHRELARAREHALLMASPRTFERIARFVVARCNGAPSMPLTAKIPMSRRDMASFLSTTPETISRFVQTMVRSGVLRVKNARTLLVLDLPRLQAMAGQRPKHTMPSRYQIASEGQKSFLN